MWQKTSFMKVSIQPPDSIARLEVAGLPSFLPVLASRGHCSIACIGMASTSVGKILSLLLSHPYFSPAGLGALRMVSMVPVHSFLDSSSTNDKSTPWKPKSPPTESAKHTYQQIAGSKNCNNRCLHRYTDPESNLSGVIPSQDAVSNVRGDAG